VFLASGTLSTAFQLALQVSGLIEVENAF
jgi:hypothetical protein